jgi:hypothetical protein
MGTPVPASGRPTVSVIVPARNEEASLAACLESLVSQTGVPFEIIVVDDGSTDRTHSIAESFPGIRVIEPGPLPPGWSGKNNAVTAGVRDAQGQWLLFTDADTVHKPGSLVRAIAEAQEHHADLLSYSPEQEVHGFWEKTIVPVIFAELAETYPLEEVSDPRSPKAAANGQYLLVSHRAYDAVGGHVAVADSLLEDVALARLVKQSGCKMVFRYGGDAVRTRMYRSLPQLLEGWTKNLVLLFPKPGQLAVVRLFEFVFLLGTPYWTISWLLSGGNIFRLPLANGLIGTLIVLSPIAIWSHFLRRMLHAHFSWQSNILGILGLPMFSYLLLRSKWFHRSGKVLWKGRSYSGIPGIGPAS